MSSDLDFKATVEQAAKRAGPRLTLLVPSPNRDAAAWDEALARVGNFRFQDDELKGAPVHAMAMFVVNDGFALAFEHVDIDAGIRAALDSLVAVPGALVVEIFGDLRTHTLEIAELVHMLALAGGLAVRVEQSRAAMAIDDWIASVKSHDPVARIHAGIACSAGDSTVRTVGMHTFGFPDAVMTIDESADEDQAVDWLFALCAYQISENPVLLSGHRFTPDPSLPLRPLDRWPDGDALSSHPKRNPYGVWRVGAPNTSISCERGELAVCFIPSLISQLFALEEENGDELTTSQINALRDSATVMTMTHKDAKVFEHARGFADINPERAAAEYAIVRALVDDTCSERSNGSGGSDGSDAGVSDDDAV